MWSMSKMGTQKVAAISFTLGLGIGGYFGLTAGMESERNAQAEYEATTTTISPESAAVVGKFLVSHVTDGDTFRIQLGDGEATIRVLGIDAPELHKTAYEPVQCFAQEATNEAARLLLNKTVELEIDPEADDEDGNNRYLRKVRISNNGKSVDYSRYMVEHGYAVAYRRYRSTDRETLIAIDEASAREHQRGMWDACPMDLSKVPKNLGSEMPIPAAG